jgi:hypothetical protein
MELIICAKLTYPVFSGLQNKKMTRLQARIVILPPFIPVIFRLTVAEEDCADSF